MIPSHTQQNQKICKKHNEPIILFDEKQNQPLCVTCVQKQTGMASISQIDQKYEEMKFFNEKQFQEQQQQLQQQLDSILFFKGKLVKRIDEISQILIDQIDNIKQFKKKIEEQLIQRNYINTLEQLNTQLKEQEENHQKVQTNIKQLFQSLEQKYLNANQFNQIFRQQSCQQQQQQLQLISNQAEQIILNRFYLYKNLEFLISLIYAYQTIREYFNDPKHDMVTIALNKIILQLNLTNTRHFEMQQTSKEKQVIFDLQVQKQNAGRIFVEIFKNLKNEKIKEELFSYIKFYLESLQNDMKPKQLPIVQTQNKSQFDQELVDNIFQNMQIVDQQIQDFKNKLYEIPAKEELIQKAQNYQNIVLQQLSKNFTNGTLNKSQTIQNQNRQQQKKY